MFGGNGDEKQFTVPWPEYLRERLVKKLGLRLVLSCMPGRTSRWNDAKLAENTGEWAAPNHFSGLYHFGTVFSSHSPAWVIIGLGTNDLKTRIREEASRVMSEEEKTFTFRQDLTKEELETLRREARNNSTKVEDEQPIIVDAEMIARAVQSVGLKARKLFQGHCHEGDLNILVLVPPSIQLTSVASKAGFDAESVKLSKQFPEMFEKVGKEYDIKVLSFPTFKGQTWPDGIHPTPKHGKEIAELVWKVIEAEDAKKQKKAS